MGIDAAYNSKSQKVTRVFSVRDMSVLLELVKIMKSFTWRSRELTIKAR